MYMASTFMNKNYNFSYMAIPIILDDKSSKYQLVYYLKHRMLHLWQNGLEYVPENLY